MESGRVVVRQGIAEKRVGWRRGRKRLAALLLALIAVVLGGCVTLPPPPGFVRNGGLPKAVYPEATSAEALYSLMVWYEETMSSPRIPEDWMREVRRLRETTAVFLHRQWAADLARQGKSVVTIDAEGILKLVPEWFGREDDLAEGLRLLELVRGRLERPLEITVPAAECRDDAFWQQTGNKARDDFAAWARDRRLTVPDPSYFRREDLLNAVNKLHALATAKKRVVEAMAAAETLAAGDDIVKALDILTEARKKLPDGVSFADLGDRQTMSSFDALLGSLPDTHITRILAAAETGLAAAEKRLADGSVAGDVGAQSPLSALEKTLSESLRVWRNDSRFALALVRHGEVIARLVSRSAKLRTQVWRTQLRQLAERQEYWEASEQFKAWRLYLKEQAQQDMELYSMMTVPGKGGAGMSHLKIIEQVLQEEYLAILPKAMAEYQAVAERALNIMNKYGLAVASCVMLQQMTSPGGDLALPEPLLEACRKTDKLLARARELVEEKNLLRTVSVDDMSSSTPGVGMTYSRDLENELRSVLTSFGLWRLVRVIDSGAARSQWGYVIHGGVVANFDGSESSERQAMRTIRRNGETRRRPNPNYRPEDSNNPLLPKEQSSPLIYSQDILEQVIHIKEIERQAHVRVFMHVRGPGVSTLVEVNEFYTKKFVLEESHPFNDVRVSEVKTVYDATQLQAAEAAPTLRYDRVWTPGEMLDWARRDSLRMVALQFLYDVNQYPLYLAQRAERLALDGDATEAAEQWGNCYILCLGLDTDSDLVSLLKTSTPPAASSYESCLANLSQQRQALGDLKRAVSGKMMAQMNEYMRRQRQAAAAAAAAAPATAR